MTLSARKMLEELPWQQDDRDDLVGSQNFGRSYSTEYNR
jgi:hypothetical protein